MTNLLAETREAIADSGHQPDDIVFIGSLKSGHRCTWAEFLHLADLEYDDGCGAQEIATDLVIVFRDGQAMWRSHEYDGSEYWAYRTPPIIPEVTHPIRTLGGPDVMWCSLAELNDARKDADEQ